MFKANRVELSRKIVCGEKSGDKKPTHTIHSFSRWDLQINHEKIYSKKNCEQNHFMGQTSNISTKDKTFTG